MKRLVTIFLLGIGVLACGGGPELPPDFELPSPALESIDPRVLDQIQSQEQRVLASMEAGGKELADELGRLGLMYIAYQIYDAAQACFDAVVVLEPDSHRWAYYRGYLGNLRGEIDIATVELSRAYELEPTHPATLIRFADVLAENGQQDRAREIYMTARDQSDSAAAAAYGLGKLDAEAGQSAEAIERFNEALELQPGATSINYALAQAYRQNGQIDAATESLAAAGEGVVGFVDPLGSEILSLGATADFYLLRASVASEKRQWTVAIENFARAIEIEPERLEIRRSLAQSLERSGDPESAAGVYDRAVEQAEAIADRELAASFEEELGRMLIRYGQFEAATERLEHALELEPSAPTVAEALIASHAGAGRVERALQIADESIAINGRDNARLWIARAEANAAGNDLAAAQADLERAIEAAPTEPSDRLALITSLRRLSAPEQALSLTAALAIDPEVPPTARAEASVIEGQLLRSAGRIEEAERSFDRATTLAEDNPNAWLGKAAIAGSAGKLDESIAGFARALAIDPGLNQARRGLALSQVLTGRYADALKTLNQATTSNVALDLLKARILACAPDSALRDSDEAVRLAEAAARIRQDLEAGETLAMAYAEAGRFDEATQIQTQLVRQLESISRGPALIEAERRLDRYRTGRPWRLTAASETSR